ncbi:MAG: UDP-N-acetylglucosamine 2-epimerase [Verrucomicrobiota bacterium]
MTKPRKICVVTGSRAEYGLLQWIMRHLQNDPRVELQVIATGMHLAPEFGNTWQAITADGFTIQRKVEMLVSSDTSTGMAKSTGLGVIGMADALDNLTPDLLLILGDRFEILAAATAATLMRIPVAHIHGGEVTEGAIDDSLRHAITKLSHLHFTSTEAYRNRVVQMGEQPSHVFNFGAPGLDALQNLQFVSREELQQSLSFDLGKHFFLITFHPVTLGDTPSSDEMACLLAALDTMPHDIRLLFTMPNADAGGRKLLEQINAYVSARSERAIAFSSLGQQRYLSAMKHCLAVVGNSSSGIIEAPSFGAVVINIGDRQKGRISAPSTIHCGSSRDEIEAALRMATAPEHKAIVSIEPNPYGNGGASVKIAETVATHPMENLIRKPFFNLP